MRRDSMRQFFALIKRSKEGKGAQRSLILRHPDQLSASERRRIRRRPSQKAVMSDQQTCFLWGNRCNQNERRACTVLVQAIEQGSITVK
jgi:hypothetical protein